MYRNSVIYIVLVTLILSVVIIPTQLFDKMIEKDIESFRSKIETISRMSESGDDKSAIERECQMLSSEWDRHMTHWGFYINHSVIEKIDMGICSFVEMSIADNKEGAKVEAAKLEKIFVVTIGQDALTLMNIF